MAIIDVGMYSGFTPVKSSLDQVSVYVWMLCEICICLWTITRIWTVKVSLYLFLVYTNIALSWNIHRTVHHKASVSIRWTEKKIHMFSVWTWSNDFAQRLLRLLVQAQFGKRCFARIFQVPQFGSKLLTSNRGICKQGLNCIFLLWKDG